MPLEVVIESNEMDTIQSLDSKYKLYPLDHIEMHRIEYLRKVLPTKRTTIGSDLYRNILLGEDKSHQDMNDANNDEFSNQNKYLAKIRNEIHFQNHLRMKLQNTGLQNSIDKDRKQMIEDSNNRNQMANKNSLLIAKSIIPKTKDELLSWILESADFREHKKEEELYQELTELQQVVDQEARKEEDKTSRRKSFLTTRNKDHSLHDSSLKKASELGSGPSFSEVDHIDVKSKLAMELDKLDKTLYHAMIQREQVKTLLKGKFPSRGLSTSQMNDKQGKGRILRFGSSLFNPSTLPTIHKKGHDIPSDAASTPDDSHLSQVSHHSSTSQSLLTQPLQSFKVIVDEDMAALSTQKSIFEKSLRGHYAITKSIHEEIMDEDEIFLKELEGRHVSKEEADTAKAAFIQAMKAHELLKHGIKNTNIIVSKSLDHGYGRLDGKGYEVDDNVWKSKSFDVMYHHPPTKPKMETPFKSFASTHRIIHELDVDLARSNSSSNYQSTLHNSLDDAAEDDPNHTESDLLAPSSHPESPINTNSHETKDQMVSSKLKNALDVENLSKKEKKLNPIDSKSHRAMELLNQMLDISDKSQTIPTNLIMMDTLRTKTNEKKRNMKINYVKGLLDRPKKSLKVRQDSKDSILYNPNKYNAEVEVGDPFEDIYEHPKKSMQYFVSMINTVNRKPAQGTIYDVLPHKPYREREMKFLARLQFQQQKLKEAIHGVGSVAVAISHTDKDRELSALSLPPVQKNHNLIIQSIRNFDECGLQPHERDQHKPTSVIVAQRSRITIEKDLKFHSNHAQKMLLKSIKNSSNILKTLTNNNFVKEDLQRSTLHDLKEKEIQMVDKMKTRMNQLIALDQKQMDKFHYSVPKGTTTLTDKLQHDYPMPTMGKRMNSPIFITETASILHPKPQSRPLTMHNLKQLNNQSTSSGDNKLTLNMDNVPGCPIEADYHGANYLIHVRDQLKKNEQAKKSESKRLILSKKWYIKLLNQLKQYKNKMSRDQRVPTSLYKFLSALRHLIVMKLDLTKPSIWKLIDGTLKHEDHKSNVVYSTVQHVCDVVHITSEEYYIHLKSHNIQPAPKLLQNIKRLKKMRLLAQQMEGRRGKSKKFKYRNKRLKSLKPINEENNGMSMLKPVAEEDNEEDEEDEEDEEPEKGWQTTATEFNTVSTPEQVIPQNETKTTNQIFTITEGSFSIDDGTDQHKKLSPNPSMKSLQSLNSISADNSQLDRLLSFGDSVDDFSDTYSVTSHEGGDAVESKDHHSPMKHSGSVNHRPSGNKSAKDWIDLKAPQPHAPMPPSGERPSKNFNRKQHYN